MSNDSEIPPAEALESPRCIPRTRSSFRVADKGRPVANVDFDFWAKMALWTIDEAVALSFERDPETVSWESLQMSPDIEFAENYRRVRKLALRAKEASLVSDPCPPWQYIDWMERNCIKFPDALLAALSRQTERLRHWKPAQMLDILLEPHSETPTNQKWLNTVLRFGFGLSVAIYKYDPRAKRSDVPKQIQSDLGLCGISICLDTIRKILREGESTADFIPLDHR